LGGSGGLQFSGVVDGPGASDVGDLVVDQDGPCQGFVKEFPPQKNRRTGEGVSGEHAGEGGRLFAAGRFPTADGRARLIPVRDPATEPRGLILNTGRLRDQWHTMTRTGLVPELMQHTPLPVLAIEPSDASRLGVRNGGLVRIESTEGVVVMRAELSRDQRRGEVFAPFHWTRAFASGGPAGQAVAAKCDKVSGQPALKSTTVRVAPVEATWFGLLLRRIGSAIPNGIGWARVPLTNGQMFHVYGTAPLPASTLLTRFAADLLQAPADSLLEMLDRKRGTMRWAALRDGALDACLLIAPTEDALPSAAAFAGLLGEPIAPAMRPRLLAGKNGGVTEEGPRVCACLGVTESAIRHAVATHRLRTAAEVGSLLGAGTNCGSCIPELERILRDVREPAA
jgi:assimilatory nitrate reductase catalytic subunit